MKIFRINYLILLSQINGIKPKKFFNASKNILTVGNGGNLVICDHVAIDIARLINKNSISSCSGILASSLINDTSHHLWVKNWLSISMRSVTDQNEKEIMLIGVSPSGYSKNICLALNLAMQNGFKTLLISAQEPKIKGDYNSIC